MNQPETRKLGQLLRAKSYIDSVQLDSALAEQLSDKRLLGQTLVKTGKITPAMLNETLASQAGIEKVELADISITADVLAILPVEIVSKYNVLPLRIESGSIAVAMTEPFSAEAIEELRLVSDMGIQRYYAEPVQMEKAILKFYGSNVARMLDNLAPQEKKAEFEGSNGNGNLSAAKLHELAREPSLVNLVNLILLEAIDSRASDVHIEPFEKEVKIKYRVDGVLVEKAPSSKRLQAAIISRIKIMANMNIAERFVPQDGHIEFAGNKGKVDIRVSTVPTIFGESITMRILDRSASLIELEGLGMSSDSLAGFIQGMNCAHGIVLVTGPTGSGKTTTLYAALNKIYSPSLKIITIEDPVEYQLNGIIQMPVNSKRGLTFATGLRHILRQDPDIIMVGEIRDSETADIAIRAALTGHLVFSTLHTNDAAGAITRLIDMGVEPFLLASSLEAVLAQRLVRKICPHCKEAYAPDEHILKSLNGSVKLANDTKLYHGRGCYECMQTGTKGRVGIFEILRVTKPMRNLIASKPSAEQIAEASADGHTNMRKDGLDKALAGITSLEEVFRVTKGIEDE
ncbi:MAG: Flp pilus assembly complex ATPase component TadA [Anaerohalosphaeraceae bacterium]|nr:Flp pilus assembly complex ATPase component TadA [Anaerohalosphaeraceae bacterium]